MAWPAIAAAVGVGAANIIGGADANRKNIHEARRARRWQETMYNTAHQREVEDLREAGLNPILSANSGAASGQSPVGQADNIMASGVSSGLDAMRLKKEIAATDSQIAYNETAAKAQAASAGRDQATAKQVDAATRALEAQIPAIKAKARVDKRQADWDNEALDYDNIQKRVNGFMGTINSGKELLNPWGKGERLPKDLGKTKDGTIFRKRDGLIFER